jgi:peptide/nickel transport system ATP-binding protein
MTLLDVEGLSINYAGECAVASLSFSLARGESVGLVGESGSGKTQTALAILGLLPGNAVATGSIRLGGIEVLGAKEAQLDGLRARRVAMVFQDPALALNPYVRVGQQLQRILIQHKLARGAQAKARVIDMLGRVGLPDAERQYRAYPHQLSGGMRQRAMIASALIAEPELLIADEPTTALDVTVQAQILELLEELREDTALLLITHDLGVVAGHCERMLVLERGRLVEGGVTRDVFANPQHDHTRRLIAAAPRLDCPDIPAPVAGDEVFAIEAASVSYEERGRGFLRAVREVDLTVKSGETIAVVGESGSGKSSLVRAALGLIPMEAGRVSLCGEAISGPAQRRAMSVRRGMQLVFQDPVGSLNPQMRVKNIVAEPIVVHEPGLAQSERGERVAGILAQVGLDASYLDRFPHELSGGQAQRVAIARALILQPRVLVCDEAVAALDGTVRKQILGVLRQAQEDSGLSIIFITHDLSVVRAISHRVLVMYMGAVVELADNAALFKHARHPYTRALLNAVPVPDPLNAGGRASLAGEAPSVLAPSQGCAFHPRCRYAQEQCSRDMPSLRELDGTAVRCFRAEEIECGVTHK